jgi:hypothetical protein
MHAKSTDPPEKKRKPKQKSTARTPEGIKELADELRDLAAELDRYAINMRRMGIPTVKPAIGNFNNAVKKIKDFTAAQIVAKLLLLGSKRGYTIHDLIKEDDTKNS